MFCGTSIKGRCILHDQNGIYYLDSNHLSIAGNKKIIDAEKPIAKKLRAHIKIELLCKYPKSNQ